MISAKWKHDLYFMKNSSEIFFDHVYSSKSCNLKLAPKLVIRKIVNINEHVSLKSQDPPVKSFEFSFCASTISSSLLTFYEYLSSNRHKAGFVYLDSKGSIGLITRYNNGATDELNSEYMEFKCYIVESSLPTSKTTALSSHTIESTKKRALVDIHVDDQDDYYTMTDEGYFGENDEALELFYDSIVENEVPQETYDEQHHKKQKSGAILFHPGTTSSSAQGKAPDLSSIKVNKTSNDESFGATKESDEQRIASRIKQILFGKNTTGYDNYISAVPKNKRKSHKDHPRTPDPYLKSSKRCFDGIIKAWRRQLHVWDNVDALPSSSLSSINKAIVEVSSKQARGVVDRVELDADSVKENHARLDDESSQVSSSSKQTLENMMCIDDDDDVL